MRLLFSIFSILVCQLIFSQNNAAWNGKKCGLVLTYDDALHQHLDNALPVLDSLDLKATFYLTAFHEAAKSRMNEWKKAALNRHELGNHTLFHPCDGGVGREWIKPDQDLRGYTLPRIINEIKMTNVWLESLDGKKDRTFAFTCGDKKVEGSYFMNQLYSDFTGARSVRNEMHTIDKINLYDVDCFVVNNHNYDEMKKWVDEALATNSLLVILFHGVGGGNGLDVKVEDHNKLLSYIKQYENNIMIAPMVEMAKHIKDWQNQIKK